MTHWTRKRQISLAVHTLIVIVPFSFATSSAWWFWRNLFDDAVIASGMIVVIDVLALMGLALYISRIASPFQSLRHVLPFVSAVPLGVELYQALLPNGWGLAGLVATLATGIMVTVAALCFRTIEELFILPLDAAREKAQADVAHLVLAIEQLKVVQQAVDTFRTGVTLQLPAPESAMLAVDSMPTLTKTQRVAALAAKIGKSESTVWRKLDKGELTLED